MSAGKRPGASGARKAIHEGGLRPPFPVGSVGFVSSLSLLSSMDTTRTLPPFEVISDFANIDRIKELSTELSECSAYPQSNTPDENDRVRTLDQVTKDSLRSEVSNFP